MVGVSSRNAEQAIEKKLKKDAYDSTMNARKGSVKYLDKLENSDKKKTPKAILKDKVLVLSLSKN